MKEKLLQLSDDQLWTQAERLAREERRVTLELLHHLCEVEDRRLFALRGHPSMHAYLTRELCYSDGAAHRRIESMRALREVPEIEQKIQDGRLSLTTVARVQAFAKRSKKLKKKVYSREEKKDLFAQIENKSQTEVEQLLVGLDPECEIREKTRAIAPGQTQITFTADAELLEMLARIKDLTSHVDPNPSYLELFKRLAREKLKKLEPKRQPLESKTPPAEFRENLQAGSRKPDHRPDPRLIGFPSTARRAIPAAVKRAVWARDRGQCTYWDATTGRGCESTFLLQLDHAHPHALGGEDTAQNLRLRCATHNRMQPDNAVSGSYRYSIS